jgi:sugar lactone lactonase YvrE
MKNADKFIPIKSSLIKLIFLLWVLIYCISCNPEEKETKTENYFVSDLTEEEVFTSGVEGPAVDRKGNLYAVNFSAQGTIGIIKQKMNPELFIELPEGSIGNGIRFNSTGDMLIADYKKHNILMVKKGTTEASIYGHNPEMNQPNDLAINSQDILFASDPNWADSTGNLWKIETDGSVVLLEDSMGTTNGIEVSPDESKLYVNESIQRRIWVYDLSFEGDISNKRLFKTFPDFGLDGMRCDSVGNLYVTRHGKGTVVVLSPEGKSLQEIKLKGSKPTNIAFGGPDGKTCYVTVADRGCIETFRVLYPGRSFLMYGK